MRSSVPRPVPAMAIALALAACHASPSPTVAATLEPPPPPGVLAPRDVTAVKIEAHPAPAKQRWIATFAPIAGATTEAVIAGYRADLAAAKVQVTDFEWAPLALDYSVGSGDDRLDVFVRPNDDHTFSINVDAPGIGHDL